MKIDREILHNLRARRQLAGITQEALAKAAGVSVDTLHRAERGEGSRFPLTMAALLKAMARLERKADKDRLRAALRALLT